jgi:hypothetical protein
MKRDLHVDSILDSWFTEGPTDLPDRTIAAIVDAVDQQPVRPGPFWPRRRIEMNRVALAVAGVAALVIGLVGIGLFFGPTGPRIGTAGPTQGSHSYEAVFVRREPNRDILVVGVDARGEERDIARLPGAWQTWRRTQPAPAGAVSSTGLLALAVNPGSDFVVSWIVVDLLRPTEPPIVIDGFPQQDTDLLDYFFLADRVTGRDARPWWGPDDRLAINSRERGGRNFVAFVNGRTGEATFVEAPEAEGLRPPDGWEILPFWAPDGSGIFVEVWARGLQLLRPDGTLVPASGPVPNPPCFVNQVADDGWSPATCASPDGGLVVITGGDVSFPSGSLTVQASGEVFEIAGSFAGWLPDGK